MNLSQYQISKQQEKATLALLSLLNAQKRKFSAQDFFSKCDQIRRNLHTYWWNLSGKFYPYKSPGVDELHPKTLNQVSEELSLSLLIIFDKSLKEGSDQKTKKMSPLLHYIKRKKELESEYWWTILTCIACKVMEIIIKDVILRCMMETKLLANLHHGFVSRESCH